MHRLTCTMLLTALIFLMPLMTNSTLAYAENAKVAPEISAQTWLNSKPLTLAELKGKVVWSSFGRLVATTATMSSLMSKRGTRHTRTKVWK